MKTRVAVLLGGTSPEREVSLRSGHAVTRALEEAGYEVVECDVTTGDLSALGDRSFDCVFVALHGGFGENGGIQSLLEEAGLPYCGSPPSASSLAMDKWESKERFLDMGIPAPPARLFTRNDWRSGVRGFVTEIGLPVVVKPRCQGSSVGVSIVREVGGLEQAFDRAFELDREAIVEQFIPGRELTVSIVEEQPLPIIEIVPARGFFDYEAKYVKGRTTYFPNPDLPEAVALTVQALALAAYDALGCRDFSRVDLILGAAAAGPYILEVNTIPGFTETSLLPMAARAVGIDFPALCATIVELALKRVPA